MTYSFPYSSISLRPPSWGRRDRRARRVEPRGFTLVELMVAVTGGLFVAISTFVLARDGARFYRQESRVAEATLAAMVGLGRLEADLARAGFMASPNLAVDPTLCEAPSGSWPVLLRELASIRIVDPSTALPKILADNGLSPDSILLAGNYASSDEFPMFSVVSAGTGYAVTLQSQIGPLPRLGYLSLTADADRTQFLRTLFPQGRALRILDQANRSHYAVIHDAQAVNGEPQITLESTPALSLPGQQPVPCAIAGRGTVNVVSFIRYELRDMTQNPAYAPLFEQSGELASWETGRTELIREELDVTGNAIAGTLEVVAEYAANLQFGLTLVAATDPVTAAPTTLVTYAPGDPAVRDATSNPLTATAGANAGFRPQRVRALRVRLAVRSRVPDRQETIVGGPGKPVAAGFYRMRLSDGSYARVRTLQADVALVNHEGIRW